MTAPSAADLAATVRKGLYPRSAPSRLKEHQHAALDALLARCDQMEAERDAADMWAREWADKMDAAVARAEAAEARVAALEEALRVYEDHRHWAISREFYHPSVVWIGPGAEHSPVPDAPGVARAALEGNQP